MTTAIQEKPAKTVVAKGKVVTELEIIRNMAGGILYPRDIVQYAKNPDTALHSHFEWDNDIAGDAYRIWQARQLIRVIAEILPNTNEPISVYVSLATDRYSDSGGYRTLVDILSDARLRKQLLQDALASHEMWERKYEQIQELIPIFAAAQKVRSKVVKR